MMAHGNRTRGRPKRPWLVRYVTVPDGGRKHVKSFVHRRGAEEEAAYLRGLSIVTDVRVERREEVS